MTRWTAWRDPLYFDDVFEALDSRPPGEPTPHVHYAWWAPGSSPDAADASELAAALDALPRRLIELSGLRPGQRVADVGCGVGGTLDLLRRDHRGSPAAALNISLPQLARARGLLGPRAPLTAGDACALPFAAGSIDVLLAVECIFHFPDRGLFFAEAARCLRPGGHLALSDLVATPTTPAAEGAHDPGRAALDRYYGPGTSLCSSSRYRELGRGAGLELTVDEDLTPGVLPDLFASRQRLPRNDRARRRQAEKALTVVEAMMRRGWLEYRVLVYRKGLVELKKATDH